MTEKDSQGRGWELKYAFYLSDNEFEEEEDAIEFMNRKIETWVGRYHPGIRKFSNEPNIVDWDGPL